jgi:purine/pyrimidine-nucleoside phosphorylase
METIRQRRFEEQVMTETKFDKVSVAAKANVYFDGKVVSHTIVLAGGAKKSLGLIYPGTYTFNTGAPETMAITVGECRVRVGDETAWRVVTVGTAFNVPGHSKFDITVETGIVEYICSFG